MRFSGFDWDDGNRTKCQKHGVTIAAVESIFSLGLMILPDVEHSQEEQRFRAIGHTEQDRVIFVVFTMRRRTSELLIRPISARYMHKEEVEHYAKTYET
jgi:uncharacterized protein